MHLLDQRLGRREAPLAAQTPNNPQARRLAVEVAVEVEQVGLDQLAAPGLERRAHADADRGRAPVGEARVDAVARTDERVIGHEVGRRKAERAPALVAVDDLAAELEGRAEQLIGLAQLAGEDESADVTGGDDLTVDLEQRMHARREALVGLQQPRVALRLVPEAEVLADRDLLGAERADEHLLDELVGRALCEGRVEWDHDELLHAERGDQLGLARRRRQQFRRVLRRDDRDRMRIEAQHGVRAGDHLTVPEVHAVERADRHAAPIAAHDIGQARDLHSSSLERAPARQHRQRLLERDQRRVAPALATLWRRDGARDREWADRGASQLQAVGVAEVGDQRAHIRARAALDLKAGALQSGMLLVGLTPGLLEARDGHDPLGHLQLLPASRVLVGALATDLHRGGGWGGVWLLAGWA